MATTNKEVILGFFNFEVPEALVQKAMIDRAVSENANYSISDIEKTDLAVADICLHLINLSSESEGGYSVVFDKQKMADLRSQLLKKHDVEDENLQGGTIQARSVW